MPFFSIIIPVYNVKAYLERCLYSILHDTCKDLEIILVDDGSTDGSGEICDRLAIENACIKVIHKQNGGLSSARNAGLESAVGEWVSFIDSDDWVDQDSYQIMKILLQKPENQNVDIVKLGYKKIHNDQTVFFIPCLEPGLYEGAAAKEIILKLAFGNRQVSNSTINTFVLSSCAHLYRRSFLTETGVKFVSERKVGSEDFLFLYSLYMRAFRTLVTDLKWYNYDTREGSLTRRYREKLHIQYQKLGKAVLRELQDTGNYAQFRLDYEGMYIALMYVCIMNECNNPGKKSEQIRRVRSVLNDRQLRNYLESFDSNDKKSFCIAEMMKLKAAIPLCMIQWRKRK